MVSVSLPARLRVPSLALLGCLGLSAAARGQEVLFLHIRPQADPAALGGAGTAQAAIAAREAVWERSNARARAIIETVCTGCLAPWARPAPKLVASAVPEIPVARGVEPDPSLEASEPTSDPSIPERRP